MLPDSLSFVDVETTGKSVAYGRIIEIGIIRVENGKIVKKYNSLVDPQDYVDPFVYSLTGITSNELSNAPPFGQIIDEVEELLEGSVFVAHNVRFDYGFVRNEFRRYGKSFSLKHFCTVKLARLLYPRLKTYNLDSIISEFNISCSQRHRALGDALAICEFYKKLQKAHPLDKLEKVVGIALKRPSVPLLISQSSLDSLPETSGVYIFYGEKGAPLYIGKSVNIRDRVLSHFSNDYLSSLEMKLSQQVRSVEAKSTSGNLSALLLESQLIKKMQPLYNRQLRHKQKLVVAKKLTDNEGYHTVVWESLDRIDTSEIGEVIGVFRSQKRCKDKLSEIAKEHNLCLKLLGLEKTNRACFAYHLGQCQGACIKSEKALFYNLRFDDAFYKLKIRNWPFENPVVIKDGDGGVIVDKWCILGDSKNGNTSLSQSYNFDYDTYKILLRAITRTLSPEQIVPYVD